MRLIYPFCCGVVGQNGTLTPYPGKGIGQTWLGADGATITMEQGVLKASKWVMT